MIKTMKVKKNMSLDELIKYVWENGINNEDYYSDLGNHVSVGVQTLLWTNGIIGKNDTFTVEVEEEINNTTIFKSVVGVLNNDEIMLTNMHTTIEGIQDRYGSMKEIYAVIDGKLQLVWERDEE